MVASSVRPLIPRMGIRRAWAMRWMSSAWVAKALMAALSTYSTSLKSTSSVPPVLTASVVAVLRA
jgi:hypothetical protein